MRPFHWILLLLAPIVGAAGAYAGLSKGVALLVTGAIMMAVGTIWGRRRR